MKFLSLTFSLFLITNTIILAQDDDMLALLDEVEGAEESSTHEKVIATFKESRIINAQTTETVKKKTMAFNIGHLFGNIGVNSNGGVHSLYGLDNVSDVRFAFDYGITNNLAVGIGRSKQKELIDGMIKYRALTQTLDNHIPVSVALYGDVSYDPRVDAQFYNGLDPTVAFEKNKMHRLSYVSQVIVARKFGKRLSIEVLPTYQYRNYVLDAENISNGGKETNGLFAVGGGLRFKITKRVVFVADYFYTFSEFRRDNDLVPYYNPFAVGVEIETGGHVFHINFTNSSGIIANNFIPQTRDNWLDGGFKLGFNISRVFNVGKQ